jgi:hypothetical protein
MAKYVNWLPGGRSDQAEMCLNWINYMTAARRTAWGVAADQFTELGTIYADAQDVLQRAKDDTKRTPAVTTECQVTFKAMVGKMRYFKRHYFLMPPLTEVDLVTLGLKVPDTHPTHTGDPTAEVQVETFLLGRHQLGFRILYLTGTPDDPANKGYRIWYRVVEPGEAPPTGPQDLNESFYTKRLKDVVNFDYGDSGKTVYFAVQVENDGRKGHWGPMTFSLIP